MNESFENLCKKHSLSDEIKSDFKNLIDKEILKVFYRTSADIKTDVKTESKSVKATKGSKDSDANICVGKKANGESCTFKAKPDCEYCGRHDPNKPTKENSPKTKKSPITKKSAKHDCHAVITKTGKQCIQPGTEKPDEADFHYCKRHAEKWKEFEKQEEKLAASDDEAEAEAEADAETEA